MKGKPAVKNELILEDVLTLHEEEIGASVRVTLLYEDMLKITVHAPESEEYSKFYMLITSSQMKKMVTLWNEWRDEE